MTCTANNFSENNPTPKQAQNQTKVLEPVKMPLVKNDCVIFETYHLTKLVIDFWTLH